MLSGLQRRAANESGFTLVELLVVILIIGILSAIAIPAFLTQKSKATDVSAKELVRTAETAAETLSTDNNGSYAALTAPSALTTYVPGINLTDTTNARLTVAIGTGNSYTLTAASVDGNTFTITRNAGGVVTRTCSVVTAGATTNGGCPASGSW